MSEPVRVVFELPDGDVATAENLWAKRLADGNFELTNIPALAYGVNLGDVIRAQKKEDGRYYFAGLVGRGGHRTFRVAPNEGAEGRLDVLRQMVLTCGGQVERSGEMYFAIDLPPDAQVAAMTELLEQGEAAGDWEFEESGADN